MNAKQQRFVQEYLIDLNGTQAAIRAGYSRRTANEQAVRLLADISIKAAVKEAQDARAKAAGITAERVLSELAKIGFSDIRKAIAWQANVIGMVEDEDGSERLAVSNQVQVVNSTDIDDLTAAAISEISQTAQGGIKIKFHDKRAALVDIGRHIGMFKERIEHSGPDGAPIAVASVNSRDRAKAIAALVMKAKRGHSS